MTTYVTPPRATDGRYAEHPEQGIARRLSEQAAMLLGDGEPVDPIDDQIEAMLAKQGEHPLARKPMMEAKRTVGRIGGIVRDAVGAVSWDPDSHPRDYRGRFIVTGDDVDLPDGRRGTVETVNADGTMNVRVEDEVVTASANEARRVGTAGGPPVVTADGRTGTAESTTADGKIVVRFDDGTEAALAPDDVSDAPRPDVVEPVQYGIDGRAIVQGSGVRDAAGNVGVATEVDGDKVTVDLGDDTRTMRADDLSPTAGTADSPFPSPLDQRLVNHKPDRLLDDPAKVVPLADVLPNARYLPYSQTPFLAEMHRMMGVEDPMTIPVEDYMLARDRLFDAQPLQSVPFDHVVVTQPTVNRDRVNQIINDPSTGGAKPQHFVRYNGETYVMNGHHRVGAQIMAGDQSANGRVLDLDRRRATATDIDPFEQSGPDATGLPDGLGRGAVVLTGAGHLAFIADASDATAMRAWDDDTRAWVQLSLSDVGSVRVPKTSPDVTAAETMARRRAAEAGADRLPRPTEAGGDLAGGPRPRGAMTPVLGLDGIESVGDGAAARDAFDGLMFGQSRPTALTEDALTDTEAETSAARRAAIDGIMAQLGPLDDDLVAEVTGWPADGTYLLTRFGTVMPVRNPAALPEGANTIPADDPRAVEGRRRELVNQYLNLWLKTAGDSTIRALAMQEEARDLFGLESAVEASVSEPVKADIGPRREREGEAMRAYLTATYKATQSRLARDGVDSVTAYRGMAFYAGQGPGWLTQPQAEVHARPLSSWSADPEHARKFMQEEHSGAVGVMLAAEIPRDRILSIPSTGPGGVHEYELVVLDGPGPATVLNPAAPPPPRGADDTSDTPTWHSAATPIGPSMPDYLDLQSPDDAVDLSAWDEWADHFIGGLPGAPEDLHDEDDPAVGMVSEDLKVEAKKATVAALVDAMVDVPDEVLLAGIRSDGWSGGRVTEAPTQAAIYRGEGGRITPVLPGRTYEDVLYEVVPVSDPRVRQYRRYNAVNALVAQWAQTSNDGSSVSHAMQEIAAEKFGLTGHADWDMDAAAQAAGYADLRPEIDRVKADRGPAIEAFLQAQYDLTQRQFADAGITEVTVYRGMGWKGAESVPEWAQADGEAKVPLRPLSSWSVDLNTAERFARNMGSVKGEAAVVGTTVPVERILSTPRTGVGALDEWEVVVIGGELDVTVRTSIVPPMTDDEADEAAPWLLETDADFQTAVRMASTQDRRQALMDRAREQGGFWQHIPAEWYAGAGVEGATFDPLADLDSEEAKAARRRRAAGLTAEQIEQGSPRDLFDAIAAEMFGVPNEVGQNYADRRADLARILDSGRFDLPGVQLPEDWRA